MAREFSTGAHVALLGVIPNPLTALVIFSSARTADGLSRVAVKWIKVTRPVRPRLARKHRIEHGASPSTRRRAQYRMLRVSNTANDGGVRPPIEVPADVFERVSTLCRALPEVTVRVDASLIRARSTAYSFDIRRRSFCLLVAVESPTGKPVPLLVLRAHPNERDALLSIGHPFYASRAGRDRIEVRLTDDTDWEEIRELVTESYRRLAPKKLSALLD